MEPFRLTAEWVFSTHNAPKPLPISYHHGVLRPGAALPVEEASAIAVCGFLGCDLKPFNPLIAALPRILHLPAARAGDWVGRVIDQAVAESNHPRPGGDAVLEWLSEMMFVDAARRYLDDLPEDATGWLAGLRDRFVGRALALMHERPDHPWTVDTLASEVGLSRSALHERFATYLGLAPMQYLANWRIQVASRLLRETNQKVATVALQVGYESEAAFSRAFSRLVGVSPAAWRKSRAVALHIEWPRYGDVRTDAWQPGARVAAPRTERWVFLCGFANKARRGPDPTARGGKERRPSDLSRSRAAAQAAIVNREPCSPWGQRLAAAPMRL